MLASRLCLDLVDPMLQRLIVFITITSDNSRPLSFAFYGADTASDNFLSAKQLAWPDRDALSLLHAIYTHVGWVF